MDQDRLIIRQADRHDQVQIWNLIHEILAGYGLTMDAETIDKDLTDIETFYGDEKGIFYVLVDDARIVGTVALHFDSDKACELGRMYLAADYRGQGLGWKLFNHAVVQAQGRGFIEMTLKTASVLKEALALYAKAGFVAVHDEPIGGNCDVMMRKRIG